MKGIKRILVLALMLILVLGTVSSAANQPTYVGTLCGKVREIGAPDMNISTYDMIEGTVTLSGANGTYTASTNGKEEALVPYGSFMTTDVPWGNYTLTVNVPGYKPYAQSIDFKGRYMIIDLEPNPLELDITEIEYDEDYDKVVEVTFPAGAAPKTLWWGNCQILNAHSVEGNKLILNDLFNKYCVSEKRSEYSIITEDGRKAYITVYRDLGYLEY